MSKRTFKLIKEYPGSPCMGTIKKVQTREGKLLTYNTWELYDIYPEFWEEVKEKEYEILSFEYDESRTTLRENGYYVWEQCDPIDCYNGKGATLEEMLDENKYPNCKIFSIYRFSDGEIFTIGDKVEGGPITAFNVYPNIIVPIVTTQWGDTSFHFHELKKETYLFKTEDNVPIYKGDKYWYVCDDLPTILYSLDHADKGSGSKKDVHYFSTKQAAEDYITRNRVLFITEDGVGIKKGDSYYYVDEEFEIFKCNRAISTSGTAGFKYFSTKEKAQEYLDNNKPIYSKSQFEEFMKISFDKLNKLL